MAAGPARPGRGRRPRAGRRGTRRRARSRGRCRGRGAAAAGRRWSCLDPIRAGRALRAGHRCERTARAVSSRAAPGSPPGAARAGRRTRRRAPTGWRRDVADGRPRSGPSASAAHSSRVAVRRLVAASSADLPALVEVGVARPGGGVGHQQPPGPQHQLVVGPVRRRRARPRSRESIRSMSPARALADLLDDGDRGAVDRAGRGTSAGAGRTPPGGRSAPPSGPTRTRASPRVQARPWCMRRGEQRLADALALPARQHGVRRQAPQRLAAERRGHADHARSRPRPPSSRPGRSRTKCRVRSHPDGAVRVGASLGSAPGRAPRSPGVELEEPLVAHPLGRRHVGGGIGRISRTATRPP